MSRSKIAVIEGDGIGREIVPPDLGGEAHTRALGEAIVQQVSAAA